MAGLRAYLWPLAWALLFHAVALGLFSTNWSSPPAPPGSGAQPSWARPYCFAGAPEPEKPSLQEVLGTDFEDALAAEASSEVSDRPEAVGSYEADLMARIVSQWSRPPSARNGMSCDLRLALVPTGELVSVTLVRSSGNAAFDRSAELAVRRAAPFQVPEDPAVFDAYFRSVTVTFSPNDLRY